MKWTEKNIPDMNGKIAVVTGANVGLGFEISKSLAEHHCRVIMACRNVEKAELALTEIRKLNPNAQVEVMSLDLSSLDSIKQFCQQLKSKYPHLDLLINNAGVVNVPEGKTQNDFEIIFGTNYFGPFALTAQLYPLMLQAQDQPRIVMVGSNIHKRGEINFNDFFGQLPHHRMTRYANSKLADMLFAFELDRRLRANNINILSVVAHPGFAATHIGDSRGDHPNHFLVQGLVNILNKVVAQPANKGALPILYAATAPDVKGGAYYGPDGCGEMRGNPKLTHGSKKAYDEQVARDLWERSEKLTGIAFNLSPQTQGPRP